MLVLFLFLIGIFIGSFLNVLIDRLPKDKSILGRSYCDFCKKTLKTKDLIPLLSFILLSGKCRYCHKKLSYQYPTVELLTGLLFVITYQFATLNFQFSIFNYQLIYYLFVVSGLIVLFVADLKYYIIPDKITTVLGILASIFLLFNPELIIPHLVSGSLAFLFFLAVYILTKGRGWGFGDVKFAFVMGLILGPIGVVLALYVAFLTGATVGIILILWRKKGLKSIIPFAPFLAFGTYISLLFSEIIIPHLPFYLW
ncbi:MAG: Peptidase A24A domain protein [Candidatus Woesebacteria bacterium GW2011_GWB1_38_5b]|uniref:Peptidase A24A domain protein n=1 Tax=Candidatus Woesebacteria bacterium GW2011_GWB1_38_5b TaxID=1618569 RepID=A0A0G0NAT4_9BACT|nr:MAG: Peptidase A24A domain protein [Candidatus Woesebacteria bacterium GW2011_GWB1_38_5b]